jgi:hypothetical protein
MFNTCRCRAVTMRDFVMPDCIEEIVGKVFSFRHNFLSNCCHIHSESATFLRTEQTLVGQILLIIETLRSHSDIPH